MKKEWNEFQKFILRNYESGEFEGLRSMKKARQAGDGLLYFLLCEVEDCANWDEVARRLETAEWEVEILVKRAAMMLRDEMTEICL